MHPQNPVTQSPTTARPRRRRGGLVLAATLAAAAALPVAGAQAVVTPKTADLNAGAFSGFDQTNQTTGSLTVDGSRSYGSDAAAHAVYSGGGANGFARGIFNVAWATGDDVHYGGAFFLPSGFSSRIQSETDLMRHDNYGSAATTDYGGVGILRSDRKAHLFRVGGYVSGSSGSGTEDMDVTAPFTLPEGRWFWLEVHQRLSPKDGTAINEVAIDDVTVASSTRANTSGGGVTRLRYGIVAIGEGAQTTPLELWFARAMVRGSRIGAPGGTTPPPTVPPTPATGPVRLTGAKVSSGRLRFRVVAPRRVRRTEVRLPRQRAFRRYAGRGVLLTAAQRRGTTVAVRVTLSDGTRRTLRLVVRDGRVTGAASRAHRH